MHAEMKAADEFDPSADAMSVQHDALTPPSAHSLLAVLLPANPPAPKNARVIRLFDIEAAKNDPQPGAPAVSTAAAERPAKPKENSRSALREERSKSLLAAARYF